MDLLMEWSTRTHRNINETRSLIVCWISCQKDFPLLTAKAISVFCIDVSLKVDSGKYWWRLQLLCDHLYPPWFTQAVWFSSRSECKTFYLNKVWREDLSSIILSWYLILYFSWHGFSETSAERVKKIVWFFCFMYSCLVCVCPAVVNLSARSLKGKQHDAPTGNRS